MITIIGPALAKEGVVFFACKDNTGCVGCKYFRVCMGNVEDGRKYRIIKVMDHTLPCKLYEDEEKNEMLSGPWIINSVTHSLSYEQGYICFLELYRNSKSSTLSTVHEPEAFVAYWIPLIE